MCDDCCEEGVPEDSILAIPDPTLDLAARAEQMRSSILSRRPDASTSRVDGSAFSSRVDGSTSRVTFAEPSSAPVALPPDISEGDDENQADANTRTVRTVQKPKTKPALSGKEKVDKVIQNR